jgi:hypothetical protein
MNVATVRGMAEHKDRDHMTDQICLARFDEIWPSLSGHQPQIHGIKVDVQGAEYDVLVGMKLHLSEWKPKLVIEFHAGVDRGKLVGLLQTLGYSAGGVPIHGGPADLPYLDDHSYVFVAS